MPYIRVHIEVFLLGDREWEKEEGRGETGLWGQEQQKRRERLRGGGERRGKTRSGQSPHFKRAHRECAQEVLLVATAEDRSCQEPRGRPVQMPEY